MSTVESYDLLLLLAGAGVLGAAILPRLLRERRLSYPVIYVAASIAVFVAVPGLVAPDPIAHVDVAERLTEVGVIVALTGAGLRIDRRPGWRSWRTTWRLLGLTMPLSIAASALLGWRFAGLAPATALLFGAVIAPTDPVLASDVQVGPPGEDEEHEVRFALTSEAGLNDGLAFPFTHAALAMALAGGGAAWVPRWALVDVVYRIVVGCVVGYVVGRLLGKLAFSRRAATRLAEHSEGFVAVALTFMSYGLGELSGGYGFLAVFVAAVTLRSVEGNDTYHEVLHDFAEQTERLLTVVLLFAFGAAVASGVLRALTPSLFFVALGTVLVVRPVAGFVALVGVPLHRVERAAIAFFGIRGIGSLYYLSYALAHGDFAHADELWALVATVILLSLAIHGVSATPIMRRIEARAHE